MRSTSIARRRLLSLAFVLALLIGAGSAPAVLAHFHGTPNSTISTATGPIGAGVTYSGQFGGSGDVDYYYFVTTRPNVTLHFSIRNTPRSFPRRGEADRGDRAGGHGRPARGRTLDRARRTSSSTSSDTS